MTIAENYKRIIASLPSSITTVVAAKTRTPEEIIQVIDAGATEIGHNYVQEAENSFYSLGEYSNKINWHLIGHLQKNKINKALGIFHTIQTIDSIKLADEINKRAQISDKVLKVLIEINSGDEISKSGISFSYDNIFELSEHIISLPNLELFGLMTMGPVVNDPELLRPFLRKTNQMYKELKNDNNIGNFMKTLSMGMSDSYKIAVEEGSTMVRIGSAIFGARS